MMCGTNNNNLDHKTVVANEANLYHAEQLAGAIPCGPDSFNGCSIGKVVGQVQERKVVLLTADEMKYVNPATTSDTIAEVLWKRLA